MSNWVADPPMLILLHQSESGLVTFMVITIIITHSHEDTCTLGVEEKLILSIHINIGIFQYFHTMQVLFYFWGSPP